MDESDPMTSSTQGTTEFKPGETISPGGSVSSAPVPIEADEPKRAQTASPEPSQNFAPSDSSQASAADEEGAITWTASEFIDHNKPAGWYVGVLLAAALLAAAVYLLTRDLISTGVVVVVGIALTVYGARKPRQLIYALSNSGLLIADKYFPFDDFRSFAIQDEGAVSSIVFMPLKRFGQLITIYVDPEDEDEILELLSNNLPLENKRRDPIDQLMKRIRF